MLRILHDATRVRRLALSTRHSHRRRRIDGLGRPSERYDVAKDQKSDRNAVCVVLHGWDRMKTAPFAASGFDHICEPVARWPKGFSRQVQQNARRRHRMSATTSGEVSAPPIVFRRRSARKTTVGWRAWFEIIFESQTRAGRTFDLVLLTVIVASVLVVILDSVSTYAARHGDLLNAFEWMFTALFTVEYLARITAVQRPWRYATSFFGIVDLMSVLPTYLAFFFPELHALIDIRLLRLLRVFRILKLTEYLTEIRVLGDALKASRRKILVFLVTVLTIDVLMGTLMYVVEGPQNGFTNILFHLLAITTMTPWLWRHRTQDRSGRTIARFMCFGWEYSRYRPNVNAEMTHRDSVCARRTVSAECGLDDHMASARFCARCGEPLPALVSPAALQNPAKPPHR